jgi:hypothetical protein
MIARRGAIQRAAKRRAIIDAGGVPPVNLVS